MKKAKIIGRKVLSVFLAVLMVLTAWVWVAPSEAEAANNILRAVSVEGQCGMDIVSCPTCGRTRSNLIGLVAKLEEETRNIKTKKRITVALMGCAVNGPGEAKHADVGVACGDGEGLLFRKGEIINKIPEDKIIETLLNEIKELVNA